MLIEHAKKELELAGLFDKDGDYGGALATDVMELIEVFSKQGHSGMSAGMAVSLFEKLARYGSLTPLTGADDEWNDVGNNTYQNKRAHAVFKEGKDGPSYYLDAIIWRNQNGTSWTGLADELHSRQYIKAFPFYPKSFYVDVVEEENENGVVFRIKNRAQLEEVREIYDLDNPVMK